MSKGASESSFFRAFHCLTLRWICLDAHSWKNVALCPYTPKCSRPANWQMSAFIEVMFTFADDRLSLPFSFLSQHMKVCLDTTAQNPVKTLFFTWLYVKAFNEKWPDCVGNNVHRDTNSHEWYVSGNKVISLKISIKFHLKLLWWKVQKWPSLKICNILSLLSDSFRHRHASFCQGKVLGYS